MSDVTPELADRNDSRYWYVDRDMIAVKPGDIVVVHEVYGEEFGAFNGLKNLGMAAIFLGQFKEDEQESIEVAKMFYDPEEIDAMSPEQVDNISRMPYFKAEFDGVGEIVFGGFECFWSTIEQ